MELLFLYISKKEVCAILSSIVSSFFTCHQRAMARTTLSESILETRLRGSAVSQACYIIVLSANALLFRILYGISYIVYVSSTWPSCPTVRIFIRVLCRAFSLIMPKHTCLDIYRYLLISLRRFYMHIRYISSIIVSRKALACRLFWSAREDCFARLYENCFLLEFWKSCTFWLLCLVYSTRRVYRVCRALFNEMFKIITVSIGVIEDLLSKNFTPLPICLFLLELGYFRVGVTRMNFEISACHCNVCGLRAFACKTFRVYVRDNGRFKTDKRRRCLIHFPKAKFEKCWQT